MPSPQRDAGYDVADYRGVDPLFGTLDDFDRMLAEAHSRGIRIIVDLVPNHSSDEHAWFQAALAAEPGSAERARYLFRDGKGPDGSEPPNNWDSVFGGPAWTRVVEADGKPGQWYLHLFDTSQPDFDWTNPEVHAEFLDILRFWLDRGVDGFRVDVAHGLVKDQALPDWTPPVLGSMGAAPDTDAEQATPLEPGISEAANEDPPYWGQPGVHEIYREWHALLASYSGYRVLCAEAWVEPLDKMALWVRPDEMHQAFNFSYLLTPWEAEPMRKVIDESLDAFLAVGAPPTWVLSNHDVVRHATRLALSGEHQQGAGVGPRTPGLPDRQPALARGRAATAVMLALPGSAYVYQGEELGLPEATDLPDDSRNDPTWFRTAGERYGRDGCRVPIPWESDRPAFGFSPDGKSWLPQPAIFGALARDAQVGVPGSTLDLYTRALALRKQHDLGHGELHWLHGYDADVLAFENSGVTVIANTGSVPVELPVGEILLESGPISGGVLPPDTTVWLSIGG
jgi:alpha-glucosidase